MKIICLSDIHATSKIPRGRIGNPLKDFLDKISYVFSYSKNNENIPIVFSGDIFNSARDIIALFNFLKITSKYPDTKLFTVFGQHDMYCRNKEVLTNLGVLIKAKVFNVLSQKPYFLNQDVHLYGCSWKEEIPKPKNKKTDTVNILSIHAPIYSEQLFPNHEYTDTSFFGKLNKHYDLVVSGDIHRAFIKTINNRKRKTKIVNTGPLMRLVNEKYIRRHKIHFIVYNTKTKEAKRVFIPCKPAKEVLNKTSKISKKEIKLTDIIINSINLEDMNILNVIEELKKKSKNEEMKKILFKVMENFEYLRKGDY